MFKVLLLTLALMSPALQPLPVLSSLPASGHAIEELANLYDKPAVNARLDRVWRAIPGLSGWKLNVADSVAETKRADDDRWHLKWDPVPPTHRLDDLPANPIYRAPNQERSVSLMFNVSWGTEYIPRILGTLREQGVKATFFLDGAWLKKNPDLAKQLLKDGHAIGSHGTGHPDFRRLSDSALQIQVAGTNEIIQNTLGVKTRLLAPPAGSFDLRTVRMARSANMHTILWTVDTIDWRRPPAATIVSRVMQNAQPGALILMHPTGPTADALPLLIKGLRDQGYRFKTVAQVVAEQPVTMPPATLSE